MDFLTFISKLIEVLAWPSVIIFVAHRYKPGLSGLLKSVTSLRLVNILMLPLAPKQINSPKLVKKNYHKN